MKKYLLILAIVVGLCLYAWDNLEAWRDQLAHSRGVSNHVTMSSLSIEKLSSQSRAIRFEEKRRDPFTMVTPQVVPVFQSATVNVSPPVVKKDTATAVPLPAVSIVGMMWNPSSPIVNLRMPDGSTVLARSGQVVGEITVLKIEQKRVQLKFGTREFWIGS